MRYHILTIVGTWNPNLGIFLGPYIIPWFRLDPKVKVASFRVVAQGATPGLQTVPRSEMAAVVWAAQWALRVPDALVTVYTDAQFVHDAFQAISKGVRQVGQGPAGDLEQQLPLESLDRLRIEKVKAHRDDVWAENITAWEQWTCLGNEAADHAAKQARRSEHEFVLGVADNVAEHSHFQQQTLTAFSRYLVDLNIADARLREACAPREEAATTAQEIQSLVEDTWKAWMTWDPQPFWQIPASVSQMMEENADCPLQLYEIALCNWAKDLQWPVRPVPVEQTGTITYFELFTHFLVVAKQLPPVQINGPTGQTWISRSTDQGQVYPCTVQSLILDFRKHLRNLEHKLGQDLILAAEIPGLDLGRHGIMLPLLGFDSRPKLTDVQTWLPVFLQHARQFSTGTSHLFKEISG